MKTKKGRLLAIAVAAVLVLTLIPVMAAAAPEEYGTQREYVVSLIKSAGMKDALIGDVVEDQDALAYSLGFLDNWNYDPISIVTEKVKASMDAAMAGAYNGLREALAKEPLEPYFVNGLAQPIFYYGNSKYYDTTGEGAVRFVVYVESDLDTDGDGKLDLVKALVQLPRAALEGAKFSTIYEARPYIEGTGSQSVPSAVQTAGNTYLNNNPGFSHADLYGTPAPRVPAGETTTAELVGFANYTDWYYIYSYSGSGNGSATISSGTGANETQYEDLNWYDYFLVRGYAVVESAGIGSAGSEGFSTCGSDVEINGFKSVIEWLTGDRKAYSDKVGNIEIKADWSNGIVGMTGRSYAGTTQFALATTGVRGLKTIVPVAGIASWYEYTNGQGVATSIPYTTGLAWYVNSRLAAPEWSSFFSRYAGYSQLMRQEENALVGDYGPHWARRDYTVENWFLDWGPSKIQTPMLIVHGSNDDNVRGKQCVLMYEAAKKAGVDVRWIWHQGHHMTPTFPAASPNATDSQRPYSMYCGEFTYDEWLNLWFSHYLYGVDNNVLELMPGVLAQDNDSAEWVSYDSFDSHESIVLNDDNRVVSSGITALFRRMYEEPEDYSVEFPIPDQTEAEGVGNDAPMEPGAVFEAVEPQTVMAPAALADADSFTTINSANGSSRWQNFLDTPTAGSTLYTFELPEDVTLKGVVQINFRAAISSLGSNASEPLRVHAKLVEVASPGTTLKYFGGNAMGSTISVDRVQTGGSWQGGGITSQNLVQFRQATTGTYREIAKGWLDLCNPQSGFYSYTADRENRIVAQDNIGVFHDYTLFLQPAIHTAKKGNRLALIITTGGASTAAYTGNNAFTFTIDNEATNAVLPAEYLAPPALANAYINSLADYKKQFTGKVRGCVISLIAEQHAKYETYGTKGSPYNEDWIKQDVRDFSLTCGGPEISE
jgi:X-Pro dipeptidyl-peptidase